MKTMREYAKEYQHKNRNNGVVSDVGEYSFKFTTHPDKNGKSEDYVVFLSYFL